MANVVGQFLLAFFWANIGPSLPKVRVVRMGVCVCVMLADGWVLIKTYLGFFSFTAFYLWTSSICWFQINNVAKIVYLRQWHKKVRALQVEKIDKLRRITLVETLTAPESEETFSKYIVRKNTLSAQKKYEKFWNKKMIPKVSLELVTKKICVHFFSKNMKISNR